MKMRFGPGNPEFRGSLREADIFGYPKWRKPEAGYLPYKEAMHFAEKEYPLDPYNPAKPFAKELRIEIADKLGLETTEQMQQIKLFSALRSPLDKFHGVDGFVVFEDPKTGRIIVTIDETQNPSKIEGGHKADIIMHDVVGEPDDDPQEFFESVEHWADVIAQKILEIRSERIGGQSSK